MLHPAKLAARAVLVGLVSLLGSLPVSAAAPRTDPLGGTGGGPIDGSILVQVIRSETGEPFAGAFVMVGPRPGEPFAGNWGFAGADGRIQFADPALLGPVTVTAGAEGRAYFTLAGVDARDLVLPLRQSSAGAPAYEVGDHVSGIDVNNGIAHLGDGYVDLAFVLPTLELANLLSFEMASLLGPPEIVEILGQLFEVPSNIFIPQQWELFIEIIKDHYFLYLPAGDHTLAAISGRIDRDDLLAGGDIADLIPLIGWREIDIRDISVAGNTYDADLIVDPDLTQTVTLNLANVPDNSVAWCLSLGDLDALSGMGRLVPMGIGSLDCPAGSGPCAGTVRLTTTAATGEFAGMSYFPAVAVDRTDSDGMLAIMRRGPHAQTYTEQMSDFFHPLQLGYGLGVFSWNDVENTGSGSPPVDLQIARIRSLAGDETLWEFLLPGGMTSFGVPGLPPEAPPGPDRGSICQWEHLAAALAFDLPYFDFDAFAFADLLAHGSHVALDRREFVFLGDPAAAPADGAPSETVTAAWRPNPFRTRTQIDLTLPSPGDLEVAFFAADGRRVRTLVRPDIPAGAHALVWDGADDHGDLLPSGVYLARARSPGMARSWQVVLRR